MKNLKENTEKLEGKEYASASVYGCASIDSILPDVIKRIKDTAHNRLHRGTGYQFQIIKQYLSEIEPEVAAVLDLQMTFDKVFSPNDDRD